MVLGMSSIGSILSQILTESRNRMEQENIELDNDSKPLKPGFIPLVALVDPGSPIIPQISMQNIRELARQNAMEMDMACNTSDSDNYEITGHDSQYSLAHPEPLEKVKKIRSDLQ